MRKLGLILLVWLPHGLWAQEATLDSTRSVGLGVGFGGASYRGDLQSSYHGFSLEGSVYFLLNPEAGFSAGFMAYAGNVAGENPDLMPVALPNGNYVTPNRYFTTNYQGLAFMPRVRLYGRWGMGIWLSQGVGLLRFSPLSAEGEALLDAADTRAPNEFYGASAIHFPTLLQLGYGWPNGLQWQVQAGLMNPITDYLDNIGELGTRDGFDRMLVLRCMVLYRVNAIGISR